MSPIIFAPNHDFLGNVSILSQKIFFSKAFCTLWDGVGSSFGDITGTSTHGGPHIGSHVAMWPLNSVKQQIQGSFWRPVALATWVYPAPCVPILSPNDDPSPSYIVGARPMWPGPWAPLNP